MGSNFRKKVVDFFTPKSKEPLTIVAENMASYIGRTYKPNERVLILRNIEKRILADLVTEKQEAEAKYDNCVKAINEIRNPEGF